MVILYQSKFNDLNSLKSILTYYNRYFILHYITMNSLKQQLLNDTFIRVTAIILVPDQYTRYIYIFVS